MGTSPAPRVAEGPARARPPLPAAAKNIVAPASEEFVTARDQAIVDALKLRHWNEPGLLTVLPTEPGQTAEQRQRALTSALIRLRVKKKIAQRPDGAWTLL